MGDGAGGLGWETPGTWMRGQKTAGEIVPDASGASGAWRNGAKARGKHTKVRFSHDDCGGAHGSELLGFRNRHGMIGRCPGCCGRQWAGWRCRPYRLGRELYGHSLSVVAY